MSKEYCPCCSIYEFEEYDPVENWKIPELANQFASVAFQSVESVIKAVEMKNKIEAFVENYTGDLFNASALFILEKGRFEATKDSVFMAYSILRRIQLASLKVSKQEVSRMPISKGIAAAVKKYKYKKDIYGLSPVWVLKIAHKKETWRDLAEALNAIDAEL